MKVDYLSFVTFEENFCTKSKLFSVRGASLVIHAIKGRNEIAMRQLMYIALRKTCPYSESFSPHVGKCGSE